MSKWEDSYDEWKTTPPDDNNVFCIDSLGDEICYGDTYYDINDMILSERSMDDCSHYLQEENEMFECACCGSSYHIDSYDELYYEINGDKFCSECAMVCELEAEG